MVGACAAPTWGGAEGEVGIGVRVANALPGIDNEAFCLSKQFVYPWDTRLLEKPNPRPSPALGTELELHFNMIPQTA